jgi:hypothetical protein
MFALVLYWSWTAGAAAVSHFPARACVSDVSLGAAVGDASGTASLSESAAGFCALADEGLVCP